MSLWTLKLVVKIKALYLYSLGIFSGFLAITICYSYMLHKKLTPSRKNYLVVAF